MMAEDTVPRMTYRERREGKAARLREWAEKRETRAEAVFKQGERYRGDVAFNTQPGHIPERARLIAREQRAYESLQKAKDMKAKAASIAAATGRAIYNDDEDAVEQLRERIEGLEAERDRIKAFNKSCKEGEPDESLLDDKQRSVLGQVRKVQAYALGKHGEFPGYAIANLSGNIRRNKQRLDKLTGAKNPAKCTACGYRRGYHERGLACEEFRGDPVGAQVGQDEAA